MRFLRVWALRVLAMVLVTMNILDIVVVIIILIKIINLISFDLIFDEELEFLESLDIFKTDFVFL